MSQAFERADHEADGTKKYLLAGYYALAGNFSLVVILFGLFVIGFGATALNGMFGVLEHRILAGMFGVWGTSIVLLGVLTYVGFWLNDLYARIESDD